MNICGVELVAAATGLAAHFGNARKVRGSFGDSEIAMDNSMGCCMG